MNRCAARVGDSPAHGAGPGDELSDDPDRVQQKLDGARILIATPQRLQATLATYDELVAIVPASQPYQPPVIHAGTYDLPAPLCKSEFA